jgi:aldehyde dehydrogenase
VNTDREDIERIVRAVVAVMNNGGNLSAAAPGARGRSLSPGVFYELDDAVAEAHRARKALNTVSMRENVVAAIRRAGEEHARELAELAVAETGMGRVEDKIVKKLAQARRTPGPECLAPLAVSGDRGLTLIENAAWGVIASVTPSTNPAATVINNAISMVSAGNAVVFAPHPAAKGVSQRAISLINEAVVAAGGPNNIVTTVAEPDIETAQRLFRYPGISLLTVTGGEAVVHAARAHTDKRLIAAGAGNPPVVVDESADIARAARDIVFGASFDNNIICADEKELIAVARICDALKAEMKKHKAVALTPDQVKRLEPLLLTEIGADGKGVVNRDYVGRDAAKIAAAIGLDVPADTRLLFAETPADHPFAVTELMMPVLPVIRADTADEAISLAVRLEGGNLHTAAMHSKNLDNLDRMANEINTSIFVKNGPCLAGLGFGGEGWTTMTISTPTGEGVTSARTFVRLRRCVMVDHFRIV